ncbi:MAG TPA: hydroxymethylbilane synthase [Vicinamibacterales bacterium]|nr:hydroxymethylbilane synthase [Vicinamibacterales bacterium]
MSRVARLGTRGSALARWQSEFIATRLRAQSPDLHIEIVEISSKGDEVTDQPLWQVEGTGFFTATIERALSDGDIDIAVHSYKDLPVVQTPGLVVAAVPPRAPVEDTLCARHRATLVALRPGARVGTCSARRTAQVRALRPDLDLVPLRGNVPTRVARVTDGDLDAIVLARAGLVRLGLERHITEVFAVDRILPAPAQGALAIQCRQDDAGIVQSLSRLDDLATRRAITAERAVLHALGGGCSVPVGAVATTREGGHLALTAGVFSLDGLSSSWTNVLGDDPVALGEDAARQLLSAGAQSILAAFERSSRLETTGVSGDLR